MADGKRSPLDTVGSLINSAGTSVTVAADFDEEAIEQLAARLLGFGPESPLQGSAFLLRTNLAKSGWTKFIDLLGDVLTAIGAGAACDPDRLVDLLLDGHVGCPEIPFVPVQPDVYPQLSTWANPDTRQDLRSARRILSAWGCLEALLPPRGPALFSAVAGGVRPLIYVFDDYNNFLSSCGDLFTLEAFSSKQVDDEAAACLFDLSANELRRVVWSHCRTLNNLSIGFEVRAPRVWLDDHGEPGYRQVSAAIPFDVIERERSRVSAFVVDLEWMPERIVRKSDGGRRGWADIGHLAIHLLSRRFPEIPCFVYTGQWSTPKLQRAQSFGAAWCFWKESHHGVVEDGSEEQLTCLSLSQHLAAVASMQYGAFREPPYLSQLRLDMRTLAGRRLVEQLGIKLPLGRCGRGRQLERLVSRLFPDGASVDPVYVQRSGKSKAQATFFLAVQRRERRMATRFVKIGPWMEILKENLAYQEVIRPRLNSFAANVIGDPVLADGVEGEVPIGALVYSLAGLPEGFQELRSLGKLLQDLKEGRERKAQLIARIRSTIEDVLAPLHGIRRDADFGAVRLVSKPLACWLGTTLPQFFTGELLPVGAPAANEPSTESYRAHGYKDGTAWILSADDMSKLGKAAVERTPVQLTGFQLEEVEWGENELDPGQVTLRHADLGYRVRLRGSNGDLRRRFGTGWFRHGFPLEVSAIIDEENRDLRRLRSRFDASCRSIGWTETAGIWAEGSPQAALMRCDPLVDPFSVVDPSKAPAALSVAALEGAIHGDLNLENILFARDADGPGWLIDFERAEACGMLAADFAKLEVEIWQHHFLPLLEEVGGLASEKDESVRLVGAAMRALDARNLEMFRTLAPARLAGSNGLLDPLIDLLEIVVELRAAASRAGIPNTDVSWALAALFLTSIKFAPTTSRLRPLHLGLASSWHLAQVCPRAAPCGEAEARPLEDVLRSNDPRAVDGLLSECVGMPQDGNQLATALANTGSQIEWEPSDPERWDFCSTGCIGDLSPLFGWLWLMARSRNGGSESFPLLATKLTAGGSSCGTVDTLTAGGMTFCASAEAIVQEARNRGGVIAQAGAMLAPADQRLLERRHTTNTMKNATLTYASILGKAAAAGVNHLIVDVKVGRDTKFLAPSCKEGDEGESWRTLLGPSDTLICRDDAVWKGFASVLQRMNVTLNEGTRDLQWRESWIDGAAGSIQRLRWVLTNAGVPQSRAVGRELLLLHLDGLIRGRYEWATSADGQCLSEELLDGSDSEYEKLYCELIPELCGFAEGQACIEDLRREWDRLRRRLPRMTDFVARLHAADWLIDPPLETPVGLPSSQLHVISFPLDRYQPVAGGGAGGIRIESVDAYRLDALFEYLCGADPWDEEVGIWLHRLPGEPVPDAGRPFVSVFFRSSRTSLDELRHQIQCFLSDGVSLHGAT